MPLLLQLMTQTSWIQNKSFSVVDAMQLGSRALARWHLPTGIRSRALKALRSGYVQDDSRRGLQIADTRLRIGKRRSMMIRQAIKLMDKIGRMWCRLMHDSVSWPIHGQYHCWTCMRQYDVPWTAEPQKTPVMTIRTAASRPVSQFQRVA